MNHLGNTLLMLLCLAGLLVVPSGAQAAESYDNCTGFITSLPAVIAAQGTWCLKQDLATGISTGSAIEIKTNNVTIDCNNFKLGGLAAGTATLAYGIYASNHLNSTIRNCNIRGFLSGVLLAGGASGGGNIVEDCRFDGNTGIGIDVEGDGSVVRRNLVTDTGGSTQSTTFRGISTGLSVDVIDNTVTGVVATAGTNADAIGIYSNQDPDGQIGGNRVRGLLKDGTGLVTGIYNASSGSITLRGNDLSVDTSTGSVGMICTDSSGRARDNEIGHFATGIQNCTGVSGNDIY